MLLFNPSIYILLFIVLLEHSPYSLIYLFTYCPYSYCHATMKMFCSCNRDNMAFKTEHVYYQTCTEQCLSTSALCHKDNSYEIFAYYSMKSCKDLAQCGELSNENFPLHGDEVP
jgi:hypothetical protein